MRLHAILEQAHEIRIKERVVVGDLEADQPCQRGVVGKQRLQRRALLVVHDEDELGPVEHLGVDVYERVGVRARRAHVQVGTSAEDPFGGGAPAAVLTADEKYPVPGAESSIEIE